VTLYTADNCGPCVSARSMLSSRGVPFTEKTVNTSEDTKALQRLSGETSLPFATIGGQQLKGCSDVEWTQFLNAAGYPQTSTLPPSYRQQPAAPLVAIATAAPKAAASTPAAAPRAPVAPAPTADNPAGIKF
jgi:glutaredoxin